MRLSVLPTADVDLPALRGLLDAAFDDRFADTDWDHCLGGVHVLAHLDDELVGHAAVVGRHFVLAGRTLRVGYVEAVATTVAARGRGVGWAVMTEVERLVRGGHELGALAASDAGMGLYRRRGWVPWGGGLAALTPDGVRPTPEDVGSVLVLPGAVATGGGTLTCDWRAGDLW